jgi:hypothetical protein
MNWASSLDKSVGCDNVSVATHRLATTTRSNGIDHSVASIRFDATDSLTFFAGSLMVADPSSIGGTLTPIGGTLALNGSTAIGALTQVRGTLSGAGTVTVAGRATFALPSAILQAAGERISSKTHLRGEPACR